MVIVLLKIDSFVANLDSGLTRLLILAKRWVLLVTGTIPTMDLAWTAPLDINGAIIHAFQVSYAMPDSSSMLEHALMFLLNVQPLIALMEHAPLALSATLFKPACVFLHKMFWRDLTSALSPAKLVLVMIEDIASAVRFIMSLKEEHMENVPPCFIDRNNIYSNNFFNHSIILRIFIDPINIV